MFTTGLSPLELKRRHTIVLTTIATRLPVRRKGAGALAIRWGVEQARQAGVQAYLEAAADAKHLYETNGFREIGVGDVVLSNSVLKISRMICEPCRDISGMPKTEDRRFYAGRVAFGLQSRNDEMNEHQTACKPSYHRWNVTLVPVGEGSTGRFHMRNSTRSVSKVIAIASKRGQRISLGKALVDNTAAVVRFKLSEANPACTI